MRSEIFRAYVEQMLAPPFSKGDVVVLDNLATHKVEGIVAVIRVVEGSLLYLPPSSLDFNPFEQLFAKLKALLRIAGERTEEALWISVGELLDGFSSKGALGPPWNCGCEFV